MSSSSNKKIIPIIIVAVIAIGAFAVIFNSDPTQNQNNEIEQTNVSEKIKEPIQKIEDVSESALTSKLESDQNPSEIEKANVSEEVLGPIQEIKETSEPESALTSKLESDQNPTKKIEKANVSAEMLDPIQEIKETSEPESALTSKLESDQNPILLRAAIIDQLDYDIPNYKLQTNATRMLEGAGYQVDLFTTKDITVDFYKNLPSMNYNFILIRTHGGEGNPDEKYPTRLFTGEKYDAGKYTLDQLTGLLGHGEPYYEGFSQELEQTDDNSDDGKYFTIGSKLVNESMVGTFPDSIIIVGGCQTARSHDLMESLINRGASHVLGWDSTIRSFDNDRSMYLLLEDVLVNNATLYDTTAKINKELVPGFKEFTILKLFSSA